jgi:protein involved in polysaccharide export with SLBB domain
VHGTGYGKILIRVMMFGAVPQQGVHYYPEGTDLLFAILYAGGYADHTKLNGIKIRRRGQKDRISIDLQSLMEEGEKIPKLSDGDVVDIPYNWRRDAQTFTAVTGCLTAITTFTLAMVALSK